MLTMQDKIALANLERNYLEPPDIPDVPEPEKEPGYSGVGTNKGIFVPEESALDFALERSGLKIADKAQFESEWGEGGKEFVELFYSGDWVKEGGS